MNTIEAITKRRSIRNYTDKTISEEEIKKIIELGMYAPSAANQQPWEFIIVTDRQKLLDITQFHEYSSMLKQAPCAIIVCCNLVKTAMPQFWVQDCSAATENILIAATDLGIGSVWLGVYPDERKVKELRNIFSIPENVVPLNIISLGYPAVEPKTPERYNPDAVHYEKW